MKKLILIALAFVSLQAVAQGKEKMHRKERGEQMKNMSAEDMATITTKKLTLALDLTTKQQAQVKEIMLEEATARQEKMAEREKMKNDENAKKPSKEERVKMMNARLDSQIAMKQKMKTILDADQYEKWEGMQGKRGEKGKRTREGKHKN